MKEVLPKPKTIAERVDDVVGIFSPSWSLRRKRSRVAGEILSKFGAYRGASKSRLRSEWIGSPGSPDTDLLSDLPELRTRSRDLNRNDGIAAGITATIVCNEVGTGIWPQSRIDKDALGLDDAAAEAIQRQCESAWREWSGYADAGERMDIVEIQRLADRQIIENGEIFLLRQVIDDPSRPYKVAWQAIEADRVATPPGMKGDSSIREGIRIGARGEPVTYFVRRTHPGDLALGQIPRDALEYDQIPAKDAQGRPNVLHLYHVMRPGQTHGEPFFSPVLDRFKDLADYLEAEVVAARVAACFSLWIKKGDPYGASIGAGTSANSAGQRLQSIEPGMIEYLGPGDEVIDSNPSRPSGNFDPFVERMLRLIGSALGLPYELVAKDFSKTNYSSARAALLEARRYFRMRQEWLARRLCQPMWEALLEEAYLLGQIEFPDFYANWRACTKARWIPPGWQWVDPTKEVAASRDAVTGCISTLAEENAGQGRDWEDTGDQREREIRAAIRRAKAIEDETGISVPWQAFDGTTTAAPSVAAVPQSQDAQPVGAQ